MAGKLKLAGHLNSDELRDRYRGCDHVIEKTRWHALWRVSLGEPATQVGPMLGLHAQSVRRIVARYNQEGVEGVRDQRRDHLGGRPTYLNDEAQEALRQALSERHPDGGVWTGSKINQWIEEHLEHKAGNNIGWRYLKRLKYSPQSPRPRSHKADPAQQAAFKK